MMFSNSAGSSSRPLRLSVYWKSWPFGAGGAPTWPAVTSWLCCWMTLMTSCGVSPRACSRSGFSQTRMAYCPAPSTVTSPTPFEAAQLVLHVDDGVVRQEQAVEAAVGRDQRDEFEDRGRLLLGRHALDLHFLRQRRKRGRDPVLDQDLRLVGVGADREGDGERVGAVVGAGRLHVDHVLDAVDVAARSAGRRNRRGCGRSRRDSGSSPARSAGRRWDIARSAAERARRGRSARRPARSRWRAPAAR